MDIRNLKQTATQHLEHAPQEKKIVLIYTGIAVGLSVITAVVSFLLGQSISNFGGLRNMGTRSLLSTLQTMLPLLQAVLLMCLEVGYLAAMLRISRGQYTSPQTLRLGFDRFWVLLRFSVIQGLIYSGIFFAAVYAATMLYLMTPYAQPLLTVLMPLAAESSLLNPSITLDAAMTEQIGAAMTPLLLLSGLLFCLLAVPFAYRLRMTNYVIIDKPGIGALAAMRQSRWMMRGKCWKLLKLDLSFWWFYAALFAATLVGNADQWLADLGVVLPFSPEVGYFLFYLLFWAMEFVIYYCLRNRVEVTYGLVYDWVKPEEKKDSGVVLGNIFQM